MTKTNLATTMTERELQSAVRDALRVFKWRSYHSWLSIRSDAGFPDLVAVRGGQLLVVELKSERGKVTEAQAAWLEAFARAGAEAHVWRPSSWLSGEVEKCLR